LSFDLVRPWGIDFCSLLIGIGEYMLSSVQSMSLSASSVSSSVASVAESAASPAVFSSVIGRSLVRRPPPPSLKNKQMKAASIPRRIYHIP